jgi:3-deoxy-manno-octulosonate cytidylyltransferase (CMP-KDO synthetase)
MSFRVVIPARFDSSRLPGKALLPLAGKPMLQWVHERAQELAGRRGHRRHRRRAHRQRGARLRRRRRDDGAHPRVRHRPHRRGGRGPRLGEGDIVVNVQGDEPLIPPVIINQVAQLLAEHRGAHIATLAAKLEQIADFNDPNTVKVACDATGRALYFSRAPIPWNRDAAQVITPASLRHVGIYAYRVDALRRLAALPPGRLEQIEKLEQLRALENGMEIRVALALERPLADVNTAADLQRAERALTVSP